MLSMAVTPSNTLTSQYPTKQENYNQNYCSIKSPSPTSTPTSTSLTMTSPPQLHNPHASITLPSIHSLDIPAFPHYEQEYSRASVFQNYSSNSPTPSNSSYSPTLLIPSNDRPASSSVYSNSSSTLLLSPGMSTTPNVNCIAPVSRPRSTSNLTENSEQSFTSQQSHPAISSNATITSPQLSVKSEDEQLHEPQNSNTIISPRQNKKNWKPRKKKQCPECNLYFSNLATHKSTHLKPNNRPHICKYCERGFARPNDLFRHVKCHWKEIGSDQGQFKCPFKNMDSSKRENQEKVTGNTGVPDHCCHNTGIFSRCDTFKNHLKAIHFQYPNGTKKEQRNLVNGKCRMCQQEFRNVDDWMHNHIETNSCPYAINLIKKEH
ncbi:hypothetical protein MEQ_01713 [Candida albicans P87]|nr:hypothetical protein MEQ_01713 [Candida albicans P87]KGU34927.1 hypothetical protein MGK_01730 [Candida albicans P57055]KHC46481.1 hypothetical protein W5O_01739 [Candida albicans Ca6]KHC72240.1 hypothetical protein MGI_01720 [Candida albicans P75016]